LLTTATYPQLKNGIGFCTEGFVVYVSGYVRPPNVWSFTECKPASSSSRDGLAERDCEL